MCGLKWIDENMNSNYSEVFLEKYLAWEGHSTRKLESYYEEFCQQLIIIEELRQRD